MSKSADVTHVCKECGGGYVYVNPHRDEPRCIRVFRGVACRGLIVALPHPVPNEAGENYRRFLPSETK